MADAIDQAATKPGDGMSGKSLVLGLAVLTLVALAGGGGVGFLLADDTPAPAPSAVAELDAGADKPASSESAPPAGERLLVPLTAVITNIASPPTTFLRVEASIVVDPALVEDETVLAAQIGSDTLAFVRSLELAQIEGARGLLHLREDLKERAQLRSPAVQDYIIHSLIAQ